jgi:hypothetical protein
MRPVALRPLHRLQLVPAFRFHHYDFEQSLWSDRECSGQRTLSTMKEWGRKALKCAASTTSRMSLATVAQTLAVRVMTAIQNQI